MPRNTTLRLAIAVLMLFSSCVLVRNHRTEVYPYSYDHTYRGVVSAVEQLPGWTLTWTDHRRGIVRIQKGGFYFPERSAEIQVRMIKPLETEVRFRGTAVPILDNRFFDAVERELALRR